MSAALVCTAFFLSVLEDAQNGEEEIQLLKLCLRFVRLINCERIKRMRVNQSKVTWYDRSKRLKDMRTYNAAAHAHFAGQTDNSHCAYVSMVPA